MSGNALDGGWFGDKGAHAVFAGGAVEEQTGERVQLPQRRTQPGFNLVGQYKQVLDSAYDLLLLNVVVSFHVDAPPQWKGRRVEYLARGSQINPVVPDFLWRHAKARCEREPIDQTVPPSLAVLLADIFARF